MNFKNIFFLLTIGFFIICCNNKVEAKQENVALAISGMTCKIGCAKTIESKLAKKEGVINAKVVFNDSIATIKYDANKTSKQDLITFIEGIAGGDLYKASETVKKNMSNCDEICIKKCESLEKKQDCCYEDNKENHACNLDAEMDCCKKTTKI